MDFLKTGVSFNFKAIRKEEPEVWEKYKDYFKDIPIEDEEKVYMTFLSDKVDGKILFNFLTECLPEDIRLPLKK